MPDRNGPPRALRAVTYPIVDSELQELFKKPKWNLQLRSIVIASNSSPDGHYQFVIG
jgi:hypothetical protein